MVSVAHQEFIIYSCIQNKEKDEGPIPLWHHLQQQLVAFLAADLG
jgi:hypothetical protein